MSASNACYTTYNGTTYHAHSTNALCYKLGLMLKEDGIEDKKFVIKSNSDDSIKGIYWYTEEDGVGAWKRFHPGYWVGVSFRKASRPQFEKKEDS